VTYAVPKSEKRPPAETVNEFLTSTESDAIRVERGAEVSPGVFAWRVPVLGLSGQSRQPLLDACREIKSLLGATGQRAALFRRGRVEWDIRCSVDWGAAHTVKESSAGAVRFARYQSFQDGIGALVALRCEKTTVHGPECEGRR
jgi:hypothetical protein